MDRQSQVHEKLNELLQEHGTFKVLHFLKHFDVFDSTDVEVFKFVVKQSCEAMGLDSSTILMVTKQETPTDCRRIISYMLLKHTQFSSKEISDMLDCRQRTVNKYREVVEDRFEFREGYEDFVKTVELIDQKTLTFIKTLQSHA